MKASSCSVVYMDVALEVLSLVASAVVGLWPWVVSSMCGRFVRCLRCLRLVSVDVVVVSGAVVLSALRVGVVQFRALYWYWGLS